MGKQVNGTAKRNKESVIHMNSHQILSAFLTAAADPSLALRMTSYRTLSFRTEAKMLCEDNRGNSSVI